MAASLFTPGRASILSRRGPLRFQGPRRRTRAPYKGRLEAELSCHFHQTIAHLDVRDSEVLVNQVALLERLAHRGILESEVQVLVFSLLNETSGWFRKLNAANRNCR